MASMTVRNLTLRRLLQPSTTTSLNGIAHRSLHHQLGASSSLASTLSSSVHIHHTSGTSHRAQTTTTTTTTRRSFASSSSSDYVLSEREQEFYAKGWVDERGLTQFKTLHENQVRSCEIFADNDLYGNYNEETKSFEYKKYSDFAVQVNQARSVLQDLGTYMCVCQKPNKYEYAVICVCCCYWCC